MKKLKWAGGLLLIGFVGIQFMPVERTSPQTDPARSLTCVVPMTLQADAIFKRACSNCHSNNTTWPWYAYVAPVSWFVTGHVNRARSHMNVSEWTGYDDKQADHLLATMCKMVRNRLMPLPSYLKMRASTTRDHEA